VRTCPLLHNVRHRVMILMPVSPLRTRLIQSSNNNLSFVCNYSRIGTVHWNGSQIQCVHYQTFLHTTKIHRQFCTPAMMSCLVCLLPQCKVFYMPLGLSDCNTAVAMGKTDWQVRKASHCGSKQQ